jgi:hypothetical protein
MEKHARIVAPGHADFVARLEEGGASGRRVRQQRLDPRAIGKLDPVGRHIADIDEVAHLAGKAISQRHVMMRADAHLLGPHGEPALLARVRAFPRRRHDLPQTRYGETQVARRRFNHCHVQHVGVADEVGDKPVVREAVDIRRLVELFDASLVHHRDAVRQRQRLVLGVRDKYEGDADFALQVDEFALHFLAQLGVQRRQWLVQQQQAGAIHQPPRQRHPLLFPAGEFVGIGGGLVLQMHVGKRLPDPRLHRGRILARHFERKGNVLRHAHVRKQRVALEHCMQRPLFGWRVGNVAAVEEDATRIRQFEARDHPEQRSFAAARGAEQGDELARLDGKADVIDGDEIAEAAADVAQFKKRHVSILATG